MVRPAQPVFRISAMIDPGAKQQTALASGGSNMLDRINGIEVREQMLSDGARAIADMTDLGRGDFDQRMLVLVAVLKKANPAVNVPLAALAVDFRLRALVRLLETTFVPDCEIDAVTRRPVISAPALRAACLEKLTRNGAGLASFEIGSFAARLLD